MQRKQNFNLLVFLVGAALMAGATMVAAQVQQQTQKPVPRAKRPHFDRNDWEGIFFENLFAEGLKGDRQNAWAAAAPALANSTSQPAAMASQRSAESWATIVDASVLEDEVKRLQADLNRLITTPAGYETDHDKVRQAYSMLALIFGIISQYDGDVRWKKQAVHAQFAFTRAAANARTATQQAYANAKQRREDLAELVRGGSFPEFPQAQPIADWSTVVDRIPIMDRLEWSVENRLKEPASNEKQFRAGNEIVFHEANLIVAMGRVLGAAEMIDADDEGYAAYAMQMVNGGRELVSAARTNDYEAATSGLNLINQACSNCHGDWR